MSNPQCGSTFKLTFVGSSQASQAILVMSPCMRKTCPFSCCTGTPPAVAGAAPPGCDMTRAFQDRFLYISHAFFALALEAPEHTACGQLREGVAELLCLEKVWTRERRNVKEPLTRSTKEAQNYNKLSDFCQKQRIVLLSRPRCQFTIQPVVPKRAHKFVIQLVLNLATWIW